MTTQILEPKAFEATFPVTAADWEEPKNAYVCRIALRQDSTKFVATAIRSPGLVREANSEAEAVRLLTEDFKRAIESQSFVFLSIKDVALRDTQGTIERRPLVRSNIPSGRDIDAAYDDIELTDEQADVLLQHRAAGTARPTVPLSRYPRP